MNAAIVALQVKFISGMSIVTAASVLPPSSVSSDVGKSGKPLIHVSIPRVKECNNG